MRIRRPSRAAWWSPLALIKVAAMPYRYRGSNIGRGIGRCGRNCTRRLGQRRVCRGRQHENGNSNGAKRFIAHQIMAELISALVVDSIGMRSFAGIFQDFSSLGGGTDFIGDAIVNYIEGIAQACAALFAL